MTQRLLQAQHALAIAAALQVGRVRHDIGEEGMEQFLKATFVAKVFMKTIKPQAPERVTEAIR